MVAANHTGLFDNQVGLRQKVEDTQKRSKTSVDPRFRSVCRNLSQLLLICFGKNL